MGTVNATMSSVGPDVLLWLGLCWIGYGCLTGKPSSLMGGGLLLLIQALMGGFSN
jgi:hypothetical protein